MTLTEAIAHCKEKSVDPNLCFNCQQDHAQLAEWLEELQDRRYLSAEWKYIDEQMEWIESLEDNWDEEGSLAIPTTVIERTKGLLNRLIQVPVFIAATGRRTIQIEYEYGPFYLEITVDETQYSIFSMVSWTRDFGCASQTHKTTEISKVLNIVESFCEAVGRR